MAPAGARTGIVYSVAAVALGAAIVLAVPALRDALLAAVRGDTDEVREYPGGEGVTGMAVVLALILVHAVVFHPAEIVNAAAGYVHGFGVAFPLVLGGWVLSGLAAYALGRTAGRPLLVRLVGERRFGDAERLVQRGGISVLLAARLVPVVPFSLAGYVAGAARVPVGRYTWTTAVRTVPVTAAAVLLGHRLDGLALDDPALLGAVALFLALLLLARPLRRRPEPPTSERTEL